jgi:hypothetical protein
MIRMLITIICTLSLFACKNILLTLYLTWHFDACSGFIARYISLVLVGGDIIKVNNHKQKTNLYSREFLKEEKKENLLFTLCVY